MLLITLAYANPLEMVPVDTGPGGAPGLVAVPPKKFSVQDPDEGVVPNGSELVFEMIIPVSNPAWFVTNGKSMDCGLAVLLGVVITCASLDIARWPAA